MGRVNTLGKILGPMGLMPTKKRGTVTEDIATAIAQAASEKSFKQHEDYIKVAVGNPSFSDLEMTKNVQAILAAIRDHFHRSNPDGKHMSIGKTILTSPRTPPMILSL
jgi:ribosomal protein L1